MTTPTDTPRSSGPAWWVVLVVAAAVAGVLSIVVTVARTRGIR